MNPSGFDRCPSCGAMHAPDEAICWMCGRKVWTDRETSFAPVARPKVTPMRSSAYTEPPAPAPAPAPVPAPAVSAPAAEAPEPGGSAAADGRWTQPILIVAFILILTGLALGSGRGTALLLLGLIPAFFVTAIAGFRPAKKTPQTVAEKFERGVTLFASGIAVVIFALLAMTIAFLAVCTAIMFALSPH